jgi:hypothetical protein
MNLFSRYARYLSIFLLLAVGLSTTGCNDFLAVDENPNDPNREDALASANDVESLIGGSFFIAYRGWMHRDPATGTAMHSGMLRSPYSYGCCRWTDAGKEPRQEFANRASGGWSFNTRPWDDNYSAISSVRDGIQSIKEGLDLGDESRTSRALAFAKLIQGWAHAHVATVFDQGFVISESTPDLQTGTPELRDWQAVRDSSLKFYDRAIEIAQNNRFTLPSGWIRGNDLDSQEFVRLVRSLKVRVMTMTPRTPEQRRDVSNGGLVDWNRVVELARNGLREDFIIQGDGGGFNSWGMWSLRLPFQGQSPWGRVSYYQIGPADNSGEFEEWLVVRPEQEEPDFFEIETQDKRIVGEPGEGRWRSQGKYFDYTGGYGSPYAMIRYTTPPRDIKDDSYGNFTGQNNRGPLTFMDISEMHLLEAEGLLRTQGSGAKQQVADLISTSRVEQGELPPATAANPIGSWNDRHDNGDPNLGYNEVSLWAMLKYEFYLETMYSVGTMKWSHARGWKDLVEGTPVHYPIPAGELQALEKEVYTFGGGGEGSAPAGWDR